MNNEKFKLSGQAIELSETSTYIEMTNRLCYYGEPNFNSVVLPVDTASEIAETLVDQPVVAKYKTHKGKPDLGGHEVIKTKTGDKFGTENIGVHTAVEVKDDTVEINGETKTLPCLFAKCKIWTRNANMVAAVKRLFSEGKLFSSWEIQTSSYEMKDGLKYLKDYVFYSNCLLGTGHSPSYGDCATALTIAEEDKTPEMLIAEALAIDIENINTKEDKNLNSENNPIANTDPEDLSKENTISENQDETSEVNTPETTEVADMTIRDLRIKLENIIRNKVRYSWIAFMFPNEKYVLVEYDERESELDYMKFTYEVNGNDVTIGEPEKVSLVVSVANINTEIDAKNDAIIAANEEIKSLKTAIAELEPYKEEAEKCKKEKAEKELAEKQDSLKSYAIKSGYISAEEIETSEEIKTMISEVNEIAVKALIVDRLMASKAETVVSETKVTENKTEEVETASLVSDGTETTDYKSVMKKFLKK